MTSVPTRDLDIRRPQPRAQQTQLATFPGARPGDPPVTSIVKVKPGGVVRSMLTHVKLDESKGEVYRLWDAGYTARQDKMRPHISAAGYDKLIQFGGLSFPPIRTIIGDDGKEHTNPYVQRDENKNIEWVQIAVVGAGMNAMGNLVFRALTLYFDLRTYWAQDLFAKWCPRAEKSMVKEWGILWDAQKPFEPPAKGRWKGYRLPGDVMLYVDLTNKTVIELLGQKTNRERLADRLAYTMACRNVTKKHFAASKLDESLTVPVVSWVQADRDLAELADMSLRASRGEALGSDVEVIHETAKGEVEDFAEVEEGEADELSPREEPEDDVLGVVMEFATEDLQTAPTKAAAPSNPKLAEHRAKIRTLIGTNDLKDKALEILGACGLDGMEEVAKCGNVDLLAKARKTLEEAQLEAIQMKRSKPRSAKAGLFDNK